MGRIVAGIIDITVGLVSGAVTIGSALKGNYHHTASALVILLLVVINLYGLSEDA